MASSKRSYITVFFECKAKEGKEEDLREIVEGLIAPSRAEPGCFNYEMHAVEGHPGRYIAYECFVDNEAFQAHLKSPHVQAFFNRSFEVLEASIESGVRLVQPVRPS